MRRFARLWVAIAVAGVMCAGVAHASPLLSVNGFLNDAANSHLVGSGADPDAPLFGDDFEIANNVAIYSFTLGSSVNVTFDSNGFAAGGVDPYFTLFAGSTPAAATFVDSNYLQAFSTGGDFLISWALGPGDYLIALGAFANMSFAENLGAGVLADGFIGLGGPSFLGTSYYELDVTTSATPPVPQPVPEPSTILLLGMGLGAGMRPVRRWMRAAVRNVPVLLLTIGWSVIWSGDAFAGQQPVDSGASVAAAAARPGVDITVGNGKLTARTTHASIRAILQEWARVGDVVILNADLIPDNLIVALDLKEVPEGDGLKSLLRQVPGYALMPRLAAPTATATSGYEQLFVFQTPLSERNDDSDAGPRPTLVAIAPDFIEPDTPRPTREAVPAPLGESMAPREMLYRLDAIPDGGAPQP